MKIPTWLIIARREFLSRVLSKWYILITLLGPIFMVALLLVPACLNKKAIDKGSDIVIIDRNGEGIGLQLVNHFKNSKSLRIRKVAPTISESELMTQIAQRKISGFLTIPSDVFDGGVISYRGSNATNLVFFGKLKKHIETVLYRFRMSKFGLSHGKINAIFDPVIITNEYTVGVTETRSGRASLLIGYLVLYTLYTSIVINIINVLRSVIEEKTSRIVEIMVSIIKPRQLLVGKILGVGGAGMLQTGTWIGMIAIVFRYNEKLLGIFGFEHSGMTSGQAALDFSFLNASSMAIIFVYFLLGYFLYSSIYAALGSMVNTENEAQQVQIPMVIVLLIPALCAQLVVTDPRGISAQLMTWIPLFSPLLMPLRYLLGGASGLEVLGSVLILIITIIFVVMLASKIYRVGILMYGKKPSIREMIRWVFY